MSLEPKEKNSLEKWGESTHGWVSDPASSDAKKMVISLVTAAAITWLPTKRDAAGNRVPTVVFDGQPLPFQAFVILVMFGFTSSFCVLYSCNRPRLAKFFRACSTVFLSCAASVLLLVVFVFKASSTSSSSVQSY